MSSAVETPWPRVVEAKPLEHHRVEVSLASGERWTIDLEALIQRRDAYWRLRRHRYFRQVGVDPLGALCWPEGEDLAPESLARYRCD
ncbi:DUF2442 domain-containing protein [Thiohalocapsa sp. ML1]|jgi:hypothetical protein|uniref:DUF2442 domain-containing protein n=1 Tax=Thiohalocapsa sp. ML1 TaxID=1431688 RepID=UPI0009E94D02|nr:DUF2442 domain-containing protein [Thiohalocapsa sp. ML1]